MLGPVNGTWSLGSPTFCIPWGPSIGDRAMLQPIACSSCRVSSRIEGGLATDGTCAISWT